MSAERSVVVIGGGVGGLSVAARLAALGWRVTLCEQSATVGGKLGLFERDGFRFDTGPSLLTLPSILIDTLQATGLSLGAAHEILSLRRLDPIARYRFADGTWWDHPADETALIDACETLSKGSGAAMLRLLQRAEAMWNVSRGPFLERELDVPQLLKQSVRVRDLVTVAPTRSLRSLGQSLFSDPRLVQFLDRYATYSGSDPRRAPAVLASILWAERTEGAWYVNGGLRVISDVLLQRCVELGVDVQVGADVVRIDTRHGQARGVELASGVHVRADIVVANADAAHVYGDLLEADDARQGLVAVRRAEPSLSGFVLCLAVDRSILGADRLPSLAHHNVLFPAVYDGEFDALFGSPPRAVEDPAIYLSIPSDPVVAPSGCEAWFVLVNAPRHVTADAALDDQHAHGVDWAAPGVAEREANRILAVLARRGVDVRPFVRFMEVRSPADLAVRTRADGGSIYGTSSNGPVAAFLRPKNRAAVRGLFLVGGSSHPGGGLPLVQLSAQIVAQMIGPA